MATKRLQEALSSLEDMLGSSTTEIVTKAHAELEALVHMARVIITANDQGCLPAEAVEAAWVMLRELAREAP